MHNTGMYYVCMLTVCCGLLIAGEGLVWILGVMATRGCQKPKPSPQEQEGCGDGMIKTVNSLFNGLRLF